jgi:hypothetical protein
MLFEIQRLFYPGPGFRKGIFLLAAPSATRGHGRQIVKSAEAGVVPISIPKPPASAIYSAAAGIDSGLRLRSCYRGSDANQHRDDRQFVPAQHVSLLL